MASKREYEIDECITSLGRIVDGIKDVNVKERIWDIWSEIEMVIYNVEEDSDGE